MYTNTELWGTIFFVAVLVSGVLMAIVLLRYFFQSRRHKQVKPATPECPGHIHVDLMKVAQQDITKPFVPKTVSVFGIFAFVFVFSIGTLLGMRSGLPNYGVTIISVCMAIAAEVLACMLQYAIELQVRNDIIFVPKAIGVEGRVVRDIPAAESGEGEIRFCFNGYVTQVKAQSVDEVVLAKGAGVRILYASSDTTVVVERLGQPKQETD
ncbi:MAG: hypothetical protein ACC608_01325 [Anaerofustis sp.]